MQLVEADALEPELYAALEAVSDGGKRFANQIRQLLAHEASFVTWKREKCPAIDRPPVTGFPAPHTPGTPWPGDHSTRYDLVCCPSRQPDRCIHPELCAPCGTSFLTFILVS